MENWPFDDPPNVAVFTLRQIIKDTEPILLVCHDEDDGAWQFLTGHPCEEADCMIVSLQEIVERDSSLAELKGLPLGWQAWREAPGRPWQSSPRQ
jgi:hypothetical protein